MLGPWETNPLDLRIGKHLGDSCQLLRGAGLNSSTSCPPGLLVAQFTPAWLRRGVLELSSLLFALFLTCFSPRVISYLRENFPTSPACPSFSAQKSLCLERKLQGINPGHWGNKKFFPGLLPQTT